MYYLIPSNKDYPEVVAINSTLRDKVTAELSRRELWIELDELPLITLGIAKLFTHNIIDTVYTETKPNKDKIKQKLFKHALLKYHCKLGAMKKSRLYREANPVRKLEIEQQFENEYKPNPPTLKTSNILSDVLDI